MEVHGGIVDISSRIVATGSIMSDQGPQLSSDGDSRDEGLRDVLDVGESFRFGEGVPRARHQIEQDNAVFQSFPLSWSLEMIHIFLSLAGARLMAKSASIEDIVRWTGLSRRVVNDGLWALVEVRMVDQDPGQPEVFSIG